MRERLVEWGVVDSRRISIHLEKPLAEHVADFALALDAKGDCETHARREAAALTNIFSACKFQKWTDLDAHTLITHLRNLQRAGAFGERTFNAHVKTAQHFARWMVQNQRATESPLKHLTTVPQTEKRCQRRALTVDEQRRLVAATAKGPTHHNMTGPERALVYRLALETGLRAGEIRHLTPASFDFTACTVSLPSAYTKNRKAAELDLTPQTAADIQAHVEGKASDAPAFAMPCYGSRMIKMDLEAAGIAYHDGAGRVVDFHALRHSFISGLARRGVHPSDAQALARHSTITLTMDHYTHALRSDLKAIIGQQPDLTAAPENLTVACLGQRSA
jgi:integrase